MEFLRRVGAINNEYLESSLSNLRKSLSNYHPFLIPFEAKDEKFRGVARDTKAVYESCTANSRRAVKLALDKLKKNTINRNKVTPLKIRYDLS